MYVVLRMSHKFKSKNMTELFGTQILNVRACLADRQTSLTKTTQQLLDFISVHVTFIPDMFYKQ
jgi:hypothetical protein